MRTRTVIEIDETRCDGCGLCVSGCHEGALEVVDGKARVIGDSLCDGLGACIGECPRGAITFVERETEPYDEARVIDSLVPKGIATLAAHLRHLRDHGQLQWLREGIAALSSRGITVPEFESADSGASGASGGRGETARAFGAAALESTRRAADGSGSGPSVLRQWPVQLHLVDPSASFLRNADLLVAADCTAYACGSFHVGLLAGRSLVIACPKLDSARERSVEKLRALVESARVASITVAIMDVPCCGGLRVMVEEALAGASRAVPLSTVTVAIEDGSLAWA